MERTNATHEHDMSIPSGAGSSGSGETTLPRAATVRTRSTSSTAKPHKAGVPSSRDPSSSLAAFIRDVSRVDLLDAKGEQRIAREIEAREIELWEHLLSFTPALALVYQSARGAGNDEATAALRAFKRATAGKKARSPEQQHEAAHRAAEAIRAHDRDRHVIDAVFAAALDEAARPAGATPEAFSAWRERIRATAHQAAQARKSFIEANLRLVFMVASQYAQYGVPLADLIQEGSLGLMTAVDRFDYRRGLRFSTYAVWWIRHMVRRAVANKSRMVRVPVYLLESKQQLERIRTELTAEHGRPPTEEELAEATGYPASRLEAIRSLGSGREISLDQGVGEDESQPRLDIFRDPHEEETRSPVQELSMRTQVARLQSLFDRLSTQEADILRKRFALDEDHEWTLREIAQRYGVSRERIRQLQNRALSKLRKAFDELEVPVAA